MQNARLDESWAEIKIARRNINNLRYADLTTLMAESEEELKSLLMKVKKQSEHSKNEDHGIWFHHFIVNRWRNSGDSDFIFLASKIIVDGDCSHEIKRLAPWKKCYDQPR